MRHVIALALLALALWAGHAMGTAQATPDEATTYALPTGELTVNVDGSARYVPSTHYLPGACAIDDTNATTGEAHRPYFACVPLHAPDGSVVEWVTADDGSATYGAHETAWAFDPEMWGFVPAATPPAYVPAP